jgi:integrase
MNFPRLIQQFFLLHSAGSATHRIHGPFRDAFRAAGFPWVTAHTFRRSVATWMDRSGLSARAAADQLGHSQVSMTTVSTTAGGLRTLAQPKYSQPLGEIRRAPLLTSGALG